MLGNLNCRLFEKPSESKNEGLDSINKRPFDYTI